MLADRALTFLFVLPIFLVSLTIHEYAHAWVAYRYGDDTAKSMGRLTLNPLAHISLFGTIIMPLLLYFSRIPPFGWAKPIPVNFSILTKKQIFVVAAAGPIANIMLALILTGAFHLFSLEAIPILGNFALLAIPLNIILALFNLIPVPPLDGSRLVYALLKSPRAVNAYYKFGRYGIFILIAFLLLGGLQNVVSLLFEPFCTLLGLPIPT
jgi:Zn-dependent protease